MIFNKYTVALFVALGTMVAFNSCRDDLEPQEPTVDPANVPTKLRAYVTFENYEEGPQTRFTTDNLDNWSIGGSVRYFTDGDTVGIFARAGNMNIPSPDGKGGPLVNIPMYFLEQRYLKDPSKPEGPNNQYESQYVLQNDTVEVLPAAIGTGWAVFLYYPYTPDMGKLENYPKWREWRTKPDFANSSIYWGAGYNNDPTVYPDIPGLELRVKAPDGSIRCRDVVEMWTGNTSNLSKGIISGTVRHGFASLIITRGPGFDEPKRRLSDGTLVDDYSIVVETLEPMTHMRVISYNASPDWSRWTTTLYYNNSYQPSWLDHPMTQAEATKWEAWEGAKYSPDSKATEDEKKRAWYVIIPSVYYQNNSATWKDNTNRLYSTNYSVRPTVKKIILYDNQGYRQELVSFTLKPSDNSAATKKPEPRYRWPIEISLTELGPTVRPVTIDNWMQGPQNDITDVRDVGIHDFQAWATVYNEYISQNRSADLEERLKPYGDLIDGVWHFYVDGHDFANEQFPVITDLQDVIEGKNQFFNVVWLNLKLNRPLFSKISGNGGIYNIDFSNIYVNSPSENPVGALVGEIDVNIRNDNTTFQKCNIINGTVFGKGPVGLLGGKISFARIRNCEFSGFIRGTSSSKDDYNYLFGEPTPQQLVFDNVNNLNIIFSSL